MAKHSLSVPLYAPTQFEFGYGPDLIHMMNSLSDEERNSWINVLREPTLGHTRTSYNQVRKLLDLGDEQVECTPWTIKTAHHLLSYQHHTKRIVLDYDQIVEFGPGIGETCRMINDLGFTGTYYLYDLPEVLRISSYYNSNENVKTTQIFPTTRRLCSSGHGAYLKYRQITEMRCSHISKMQISSSYIREKHLNMTIALTLTLSLERLSKRNSRQSEWTG